MNAQLVTLDQARALVVELNDRGIGGGVLPEVNTGTPEEPNYVNDKSGIYLPNYQGPFTMPQDGEHKPYEFRYHNGAGGMNAGLMLDKLRRYPTAPEYCYREFAKEANAMAANALGDQ